jgi:hypothetical protein
MTPSKIVRRLAGAALIVIAACNGKLAVDDSGQNGPALWTGNASNCPTVAPQTNDPCTVNEGQICAFRSDDPTHSGYEDYHECGCWLATGGVTLWYCYTSDGGPPCPDTQPAQGSNCYGMVGEMCDYPPQTSCYCADDSDPNHASWKCDNLLPAHTSGGPKNVDPSTPVAELTDTERTAWCKWYLDALLPGAPEPSGTVVDANGYVVNGACDFGHQFPCAGTLAVLPVADCVGNLALSSCEAPVSELSDCALTIGNFCWPSPHGCAPYLDTPGCDGTMIAGGTDRKPASLDPNAPADPSIGCYIRVR